MNLLGHKVMHNQFGEGEVIQHSGDYITVLFGMGEKSFKYPGAFIGFLSIDDALIKAEIMKDISDFEKRCEAQKKQSLEEKSRIQPKVNISAARTNKSIGICTESVFQSVEKIPYGKVVTYADIAEYITGSRRGAQSVSTILLNNSNWKNCHRVVMAEGKLSPGYKSGLGPEVQRKELEAEGVTFDYSGKVLINKYKWKWKAK